MKQDSRLDSSIKALRKRVRLLLAERYGLFGACAGALAASVAVLLANRYDFFLNYWLWIAIVITGGAAGCAYGLLRKLTDFSVASAADRRVGTKERLSTAVSVECLLENNENGAGDDGENGMSSALLFDAAASISHYKPNEVFRHRFGVPHIAFATAAVILLGVIFVPLIPALQSRTRRQEVAVMKKQGAGMVKVAKNIRKQTDPNQRELRKLANRLEKLGWKLETGRMSRKQAMLKAKRLNSQVEKEQDRLARENSSSKSMEQARAEMRKASADLAKRMADQIARKENIPPQDAMKKIPSDSKLAELARKDGPLSQTERQELEQAIAKYADRNNNNAIPSELGEALAKLAQNGDFQKASELMQKLAQKMGSSNMKSSDRRMLQKQMQQLAKALKGTDMDKLAKQMLKNAQQLAKMSPEELRKLAKQMQEAQKIGKMLAQAGGT